ncbi:MAG TPA: CHAT domain-containing protein [Thermoanaerobaculia bacterium]|nr:CHAT domain-containing protein [Thermoanaerobaculia bacterium]
MAQGYGSRGEPADLEIHVQAAQAGGYTVELVVDQLQHFGPGQLGPEPPLLAPDEEAPGVTLYRWLMASEELARGWAEARGQAESGGRAPLRRIRLRLDAEAPELHALPWELLAEPEHPGAPWAASEETPFSRYLGLSSPPGHPVFERPARMLVAIAAPTDCDRLGFHPLDAEAEWQVLASAAGEIGPERLVVERLDGRVTLARLEEQLATGGFHLLHLVAHGRVPELGPLVYLEKEDGSGQRVLGTELAACLKRSASGLRLLFLASCESAVEEPSGASASLARQAIEAGVPAVVAFAEKVTIPTSRAFTGAFYGALVEDGRVDRAANRARSALMAAGHQASRPPVLLSRLVGGCLFGARGRVVGKEADGFWRRLVKALRRKDALPILGPGVLAGLLPDRAELAPRLASEYGYPFAHSDPLSRIAQHATVHGGERVQPRQDVLKFMAEDFARRYRLSGREGAEHDLCGLIAASGWSERVRRGDEGEIHHLLADLPLPLYLTTNWDNLLAQALTGLGRPPAEEGWVRWYEPETERLGEEELDFADEPTVARPVVFHLFGSARKPSSLLVAEDDAFDYLVRVGRQIEQLVPLRVREDLVNKVLLLLGFEFGEPALHLLLRGLLGHPALRPEDGLRLRVAVQVDPDATERDEAERARDYIQGYFQGADIHVYWGSTRNFVAELHERFHRESHG